MTTANNQLPLSGSESSNAMVGATRTAKGRDGWESKTDIQLGNSRVLRITTNKASRGGVETDARVHTIEGGFLRTELFGDFSKTYASNSALRCMEKTVAAQHFVVLETLESIRAEVTAFYLAKNPKPWVVVTNPGTDDEGIWSDHPTYAEAKAELKETADDDRADIMKRLADGTLTTDY